MADVKISQLPEETTVATGDYIPIDQTATSTTKRISVQNLLANAMPSGSVVAYAALGAPGGFLVCDGSAVSRTTYANLFSAIGSTFGSGDGASTFNLPNLQSRIPVGKDSGTFATLGQTGGEVNHQLTVAEMPSHTHGTDMQPNIANSGPYIGGQGGRVGDQTDPTGGNQPHNNLQPYIVLNYIIKT